MSARPTLKTVAAAAGVSTATVSYAFNRPDRLSAEARSRILAVARDLGYAGPDAAARSLRTGRTGAIGVIFTVELTYAFTDPYVLALLGGLAEAIGHTRTSMVLLPFTPTVAGLDDDAVRESLEAVHRAVIDGAIADGLPDEHPAVRALADRSLPLIRSWPTSGTGRWVAIDDRAAGRSIGAHLAGLGHRDVAVVVACRAEPGRLTSVDEQSSYLYSRERLAGIREGLGPSARVRVYSGGRNVAESGRVAAEAALSVAEPPTAIAADSDVLAVAVADVVRGRGLTVGRDVSVSGFDDTAAAAAGLTTVRQPIHEKGRLMGRMLLDPGYPETQVMLPTDLVIRPSTGPAPHSSKGR